VKFDLIFIPELTAHTWSRYWCYCGQKITWK